MTPTRHHLILAAALLLPLAALAASWAVTHQQAQQGQDWLIPIEGYDPRDLLRGHYVQYRYAWPMALEPDQSYPRMMDALCVIGATPHIQSVRPLTHIADRFLPSETKGCAIILRATLGTRQEVRGLESGIFYASQAQAIALSRKLADPRLQGLVRVRVRADGVMRPVALDFRPRPKAQAAP
ncbi:GDYXXLXY domain-containing protein [Sphingobium sp. AR-3-1]|uniref:GDYXXLXY domain-containing protein n=1 Tax=Sphingobium psychrophilum TaxID=2728834 RepID=A0A7X9WW24_9SPHN|nr:GDYXXLXY domain-containing protein [Sphingobium psychrophilum]NML10965.1 GDYXXLXY domain-containing protein [Sphingobium psychrophilum]